MIRKAKNKDLNKILEIAKICYDEESYNNYVKKEVIAYTDNNSLYDIEFYVYEIDNKIVGVAGLAQSMFLYDVYELRLGATLPEYQNQGILTELVEYRINIIKTKLEGRKGMIQTSTRHPNIYKNFGFYDIFENNWNYKCMNLCINYDNDYILKSRRSVRNFLNKDVDDKIIIEILETAIQSPSSKNTQPWYFVVLKDDKKNDVANIVEKNLETNERKHRKNSSVSRSCDIIKDAPVLILVFNKSPYTGGEKNVMENPDKNIMLSWNVEIQSVSAAIQNMLLSTHMKGLGGLWYADINFSNEEICKYVDCEYDLVAGVSIGYTSDESRIAKRNLDYKLFT